jgi:hypothetical protein
MLGCSVRIQALQFVYAYKEMPLSLKKKHAGKVCKQGREKSQAGENARGKVAQELASATQP